MEGKYWRSECKAETEEGGKETVGEAAAGGEKRGRPKIIEASFPNGSSRSRSCRYFASYLPRLTFSRLVLPLQEKFTNTHPIT